MSNLQYNTSSLHPQTFSDDFSFVGYISNEDESECWAAEQDLVLWCRENDLQLNISKIKKMVVDGWHERDP